MGWYWADDGLMMGWQWADNGLTMGWQWADIGLISNCQWADNGLLMFCTRVDQYNHSSIVGYILIWIQLFDSKRWVEDLFRQLVKWSGNTNLTTKIWRDETLSFTSKTRLRRNLFTTLDRDQDEIPRICPQYYRRTPLGFRVISRHLKSGGYKKMLGSVDIRELREMQIYIKKH